MFRKIVLLMVSLLLLFTVMPLAGAFAAGTGKSVTNHWAKPYADAITKLGIYPNRPFLPDQPVSRAELLQLINRVVEASFGKMSDPYGKASFDYRHPLALPIKSLLGNVNALFNVSQEKYVDLNPGNNMLYFLYLSSLNKQMRDMTVYNSKWWLSGYQLNRPVTREEASMILFHVLSPEISKDLQITTTELDARFASLYQWKTDSVYLDTVSPYATLIKDYHLLTGETYHFQPKKPVTQAQLVFLLKRLYDTYAWEKTSLSQGNAVSRARFANLVLSAANYSYQKQNKTEMARYFTPDAMQTLKMLHGSPLHDFTGKLTVNEEESTHEQIALIGEYFSQRIGKYEVYFLLKKESKAKNSYGWIIASIDYKQK